MVAHLPQIWAAAEEIAGRPLDPLDPALLETLRRVAPDEKTPPGHTIETDRNATPLESSSPAIGREGLKVTEALRL